jgi:2-oxoglutarate dehydrogenase complex dehydrogenase (E1) component-like enzyme
MPDHIDLSDIRPRLPGRENPDGLAYGNLNYQPTINALQHICDKIFARTNESIKYGRIVAMKNGAKQKAEITLAAEAANLEAHANALNGVKIPQLGNTKISVVERLRMHVAVESALYKRRSKTLQGIADRAWDSHRVEVKIFDGELR